MTSLSSSSITTTPTTTLSSQQQPATITHPSTTTSSIPPITFETPFLEKFKTLLDETTLARRSIQAYKYRLTKIVGYVAHDVDWILINPKETIRILRQNVSEPETIKAFCNSILTLFRHVSGLKIKMARSYALWSEEFKSINQITSYKFDTLTPSEKQKNVFVEWGEILKKRDQLNKDSIHYLVLCMYTMIPPCRGDYGNIAFVTDYLSEEEERNQRNYIIVNDTPSGIKMTLVLNEFKTSKYQKRFEEKLPTQLVKVIQKSRQAHPRKYLFVNSKGLPFKDSGAFVSYMRKILFEIFAKQVTINTLRHSFVSSIDFNNLTPLEKSNLASQMMHSPGTFERYRLRVQ